MIITGVKPAGDDKGPRYLIEGRGEKQFLRMNSNSYLGLSLNEELIKAEEAAAKTYGAGPGAVRFISGTYKPHIELEKDCLFLRGAFPNIIFAFRYRQKSNLSAPLPEKPGRRGSETVRIYLRISFCFDPDHLRLRPGVRRSS